MQKRTTGDGAPGTSHDRGGADPRDARPRDAAPAVQPYRGMSPMRTPRPDADAQELAALRYAEAALWTFSGLVCALHVYRVVQARSVFSGGDTLAVLLVAALLASASRVLRRRSR